MKQAKEKIFMKKKQVIKKLFTAILSIVLLFSVLISATAIHDGQVSDTSAIERTSENDYIGYKQELRAHQEITPDLDVNPSYVEVDEITGTSPVLDAIQRYNELPQLAIGDSFVNPGMPILEEEEYNQIINYTTPVLDIDGFFDTGISDETTPVLDTEEFYDSEINSIENETAESESESSINSSLMSTQVTITYKGNGHTSGTVPANQTFNTPGSINLRPQGNLAKTGYILAGWKDSAGNVFKAGQTISYSTAVSGTLTLNAHWVTPTVTVQYQSTGHTSGSVPTSHSFTTPGSIVLKLQGTLARTGYIFAGWRDSAGNVFKAGQTISYSTAVYGTLTLNAHWVTPTVTVQYQSTGHTSGSVPTSHSFTTPGSTTLKTQGTLVRTGYILAGWKDSAGTVFKLGQTISYSTAVYGTLTLTAHWVTPTITIQYQSTGHTSGSVPTSHSLTTPGSIALKTQGTLAKTGYIFAGWRDSAGNIFKAGQTISYSTAVYGTITLEANWELPMVTLVYTSTGHTGGSVPANQTVLTPGSINLRDPGSLVRTGYTFVGWSQSSGAFWSANRKVFYNNEVYGTSTFSAVWVRNSTRNYNVLVNSSYPISTAHYNIDASKLAFSTFFGINLVRGTSNSNTILDQIGGCNFADRCESACGNISYGSDCMANHHRSSHHFLSMAGGSASTFRFVDYHLCYYRYESNLAPDKWHREVYGVAYLNGRDTLTTSKSNFVTRTTAHEISHLYGANDTPCLSGQDCVMTPGAYVNNQWCDKHKIEIINGL
jgi:hypothetical protein